MTIIWNPQSELIREPNLLKGKKPVGPVKSIAPYPGESWVYPEYRRGLRGVVDVPTTAGTVTRKGDGISVSAGRIEYPYSDVIAGFDSSIAVLVTAAIQDESFKYLLGAINGANSNSGSFLRVDSNGAEQGKPKFDWYQNIGGWKALSTSMLVGFTDNDIITVGLWADGNDMWISAYNHNSHVYVEDNLSAVGTFWNPKTSGLIVGAGYNTDTDTWDLIQQVSVYKYLPLMLFRELVRDPYAFLIPA